MKHVGEIAVRDLRPGDIWLWAGPKAEHRLTVISSEPTGVLDADVPLMKVITSGAPAPFLGTFALLGDRRVRVERTSAEP